MPTGETLVAETQEPEPPPPPTPTTAMTASSSPASTRRHRRHRNFSSSSSSSTSSLSTVSSAASSPSPSPRGGGTTSTTTTSVPFSWEHHPGIPKTTRLLTAGGTPSSSAPTPLPLPPPLRVPPTSSRPRHHHHHARRRRVSGKKPPPADDAADPFAAAFAECTRERGATGAGSDDAGLMNALFPARAPPTPTSRRWSSIASAGAVVGLLDLYGCKSAMGGGGVAEGAFVLRRPVAVVRAVPAGRARAGRR